MGRRNSHCSFCGAPFDEAAPWPRRCTACGETTYRNPVPVAVLLVPVDGGLLVVRRAIPPHRGALALPGGYINHGETWQQAGARELLEETGILIEPHTVADFKTRSAPDGTLLVFGVAPAQRITDLPTFAPRDEVSERLILYAPMELAFSLHTDAMRAWFAANARSRSG